jgi:hypothetical protein
MLRVVITGLGMLLAAAHVHAQTGIAVLAASPKQIRVDGELGEWRGARFQKLGEGAGGSAEVALAHEGTGLFVAARVRDDAFVRTTQPSAAEDAIVVRLAFPVRGAFAESELWLFAGRIGETAASAQLRSGGNSGLRALRNVQIVEGPHAGGYAVEAFVPWNGFEGGADWAFARGALRLHDVDSKGGRATGPSTAPGALMAAQLPWLAIDGGPVSAFASFLRAKNLEQSVSKLDFVGNVRDDARAERVVVMSSFIAVSGAGGTFNFAELPVASAADVTSAELRELTADDKPELVVRLRQQNELGKREVVHVYGFATDTPSTLFGVELRKQTNAGSVDARLRFERAARGPTEIVISAGEADGLTPENYAETPAGQIVPIALPWGAWRERVYAWDGSRFALKSERKNPAAQAPASPVPPPTAAAARAVESALESAPASRAALAPLEAYKRARGIGPEVAARFAQTTNLFGDARPEALAVFGRELAVTGEGLGGDAGFFYLGLPVADPADVLGVQTGDLTGDGRRELLVRVRQRIGDVQRELVYCYALGGQRVEQLLAVEVSRARGAQRIDNKVALVADKQRSVLTIDPGVARGWSASDYPFVAESLDGVAPLLLPWKDRTTSYVFVRDRLVPKVRTSN